MHSSRSNNFLKMFAISTFLLTAISLAASADIDKAKEFSSFFLKPDPSFDIDWFSQKSPFYMPFLTKLDMLLTAEMFLTPDEFKKLDEKTAPSKHCMEIGLKNNRTVLYASGFGKKAEYNVIVNDLMPARWDYVDHNNEILGTGYFVLADKKNGVMLITQWMTGMKSFTVLTPKGSKPSSEFLKKIKKLAVKQYGFDPNLFVYSNYDKCNLEME